MVKNIRGIAGVAENYSKFVREERNLAAIFYYLLLQRDNTNKFFKFIKIDPKINPEEFGIYFEYAYLRDLWHTLKKNEDKRKLIEKFISQKLVSTAWENESVVEFNNFFGATPKASAIYIQSPGRWNISKLNENIKDKDDFEKVCKCKWAFNIKPDIVIHTSIKSVVCIETKLASREGYYPQNSREWKIFKDRGFNKTIKQTEMQKYLMEKLFKRDTTFVLLTKRELKNEPKNYKVKIWKDVFNSLDLKHVPLYILETIERL